jgi:serine/threonine-protein kinase
MSPEQARGLAVDKRADIWAFGCVLYEMLTGRTVFHGDTTADHIAAILEREPDMTALPDATPPPVRRLIRRCLEKDRRGACDIADARIEIEEVLSGASLGTGETAVGDPHQRPIRLLWPIAAIASLMTLVALGALTWKIRTAPQAQAAPPRISRLTIGSQGSTAVALNGARSLAITLDGTRVVYVGNKGTQLFVRQLDRLDPTAIVTAAAPLNWVFVSPDGQWVGFEEGGTLKKVAITGGPITTIVTPAGNTRGATWAPDDSIIIGTRDATTGLQRVSAAGGELTVLSRPIAARGERAYVWPEMLPGGRAVLFTILAVTGGLDAAQVAVFDLVTHSIVVLVRGGRHAHYVPSGLGSPKRTERGRHWSTPSEARCALFR